MIDCCSSSCETKSRPSKLDCPACGEKCLSVTTKAMLHHIKQPWTYEFSGEQYFFCSNPSCDSVYFSSTNKVIYKPAIRTSHSDSAQTDDPLICFCFGVNKSDASVNKDIKAFVVKQTKASMCSCETANPSGRCCLKNFPKF